LGTLLDLCRAVDDAEAFRAAWQREGATVESRGRPFPNPNIQSEREARKAVAALRRELGVTPASAARVPDGPKPPDRRLDDLLGKFRR
jgi:phage terminase small subunit